MRGGETSLRGHSSVRRPDAMGETVLGQPLRGQLERLYTFTQALHIFVRAAFEPAAKSPQGCYYLGPDVANGSLRSRQITVIEPTSARNAAP
jgi:hypothetical protein